MTEALRKYPKAFWKSNLSYVKKGSKQSATKHLLSLTLWSDDISTQWESLRVEREHPMLMTLEDFWVTHYTIHSSILPLTIQLIWNTPVSWVVWYWYSDSFSPGPELCAYSIYFLPCPAPFCFILPILLIYIVISEACWPGRYEQVKR